MPELQATITEKFDKLLDELVETGLIPSKADIMRYAAINYLKEIGWISKRASSRRSDANQLNK